MIDASQGFIQSIKSSARRVCSKIILHYDTDLILLDDKIISISAQSSAEIALGGLQDDLLTVELIKGAITDEQFNADIDISVFVGAYGGEVAEYVRIGKYTTNAWEKNDKTGIVTIELVSKINSKSIIPKNIIAEAGTFLEDYCEQLVLNVFAENLTVASGVTSQVLQKSWLMYDDITTQLKKMAEACNGLFRYTSGFELVSFKAGIPVATLSMGSNEELIEVTRLSDYSKTKEQVIILKSAFSVTTLDKLTSANITMKGDSQVIELKTGSPTNVTYVTFGSGVGQLSDITQGITWCNVEIYPSYGEGTYNEQVEVWGSRVQSICKDSKVATDGSVTYMENPYIQTTEHIAALDKRIYEGIRYRLKYRGNPAYQVGDTVAVSGIGNLLIYKRQLSFNGGLGGILEGVFIDG